MTGSLMIHIIFCLALELFMTKSGTSVSMNCGSKNCSDVIAGTKNCSDYGRSVGRLRWDVVAAGGKMNATCALGQPDPKHSYVLTWFVARDYMSETPVKVCSQNTLVYDQDGISCHFSPLFVEGYRLYCAASIDGGRYVRTKCYSEEIDVDGSNGRISRPKRSSVKKRSIYENENYEYNNNMGESLNRLNEYARGRNIEENYDYYDTDENVKSRRSKRRNKERRKSSRRRNKYRKRPEITTPPTTTTEKTTTTTKSKLTYKSTANTNGDLTEAANERDPTDDFEIVTVTLNPFTGTAPDGEEEEEPSLDKAYVDDMKLSDDKNKTDENVTKKDSFTVEGWHVRLLLIAAAVAALLTAGSAIGTTLALKYHNKGRECCQADCCQPCCGRVEE